jgi:putative transposase
MALELGDFAGTHFQTIAQGNSPIGAGALANGFYQVRLMARDLSALQPDKKAQAVWQRRFWEHCIRNEQDWIRHGEYIHYNPVRHGLVRAPRDWKYSSFHRFVREGKYDVMWGADTSLQIDEGFG